MRVKHIVINLAVKRGLITNNYIYVHKIYYQLTKNEKYKHHFLHSTHNKLGLRTYLTNVLSAQSHHRLK